MMNKKKKGLGYIALTVLLASTLTLTACGDKGGKKAAGNDSEVVATVNDEKITKDELYDALVAQGGDRVLDALVMEKIVLLEAEKQNIKIDQAKIDAEIETMAENNGGMEALEASMAIYGMDLDTLKKNIETNYTLEALLEPYADITEDDMKAYFEENKDAYGSQEQVKASHILVKDEALAKEIEEKLKAGEDFAELAKEYSEDPGSKELGGDLGFFPRGMMVPEFEEAAFNAEIGKVTEPVKSEHGYHIIKVEEKKEGNEANYEDAKDQVKSSLIQAKSQEIYPTWYEEKLTDYKIETFLNN